MKTILNVTPNPTFSSGCRGSAQSFYLHYSRRKERISISFAKRQTQQRTDCPFLKAGRVGGDGSSMAAISFR